ncbi:MmyB family transcriptional regulator [Streptomyces sp. NBC_01236]|uniref:MmyB family transcriptional regulator n=1 Tax=Streptomyces sp. NBC_01236 TaxID=2903789 RepID=UPI003FA364D0
MAGTDPYAPDLTQLAGELLLKSPEFARLRKRYDVRGHSHGRKTSTIPRSATSPLDSQPTPRETSPDSDGATSSSSCTWLRLRAGSVLVRTECASGLCAPFLFDLGT